MILDFTRTRGDSFLALLALDKIEDASLPFGQHACIIVQTAEQASSNEQIKRL
jgi:hypothetical protein